MERVEIEITDTHDGMRLDRFLREYYKHLSQGNIEKTIRKNLIKLNGKKVAPSERIESGDKISIAKFLTEGFPDEEVQEKPKLNQKDVETLIANILYKDEDIIVLNKPAGLAVQGGTKIKVSVDDLLEGLKFEKTEKPRLTHRIDKETSGILVVARTRKAATRLTEDFRDKNIEKVYLAICQGVPKPISGKISDKIAKIQTNYVDKLVVSEDGDEAISFYKTLDASGKLCSLLELRPVTGRTHQLRIHTQNIGNPIVGDDKYSLRDADQVKSSKLMLHAYKIQFTNMDGKEISVTAPLPPHMKDMLALYGMKF